MAFYLDPTLKSGGCAAGEPIVASFQLRNPFCDVDETLYALWRKPSPAIPPVDPSIHFDEIEIGDWW